MECKQCGKTLTNQERFCTLCGYYNDPDDLDMDEESLEPIKGNSKTKELIQDHNEKIENVKTELNTLDKLRRACLKAYLNTDYENVIDGKFNIFALLFSWIYFIYKKMYLIGIPGLLIAGVLLIYQKLILIIFAIISMAVSGLLFNKIYLWYANRIIEKSISKHKNPNVIIKECKRKGKDNVFLTLTIYFIFLTGLIIAYFTLGTNNSDSYWKINGDNKATCLSMIETAKSISNTNTVAFLIEAGCLVENSELETYHLYLKFDLGDRTIIEKYSTASQKLYFDGSTDKLKEYETNKAMLGNSELQYYNEMIKLEKSYADVLIKAQEEDDLINNKSNTVPKAYFKFDQKELNR